VELTQAQILAGLRDMARQWRKQFGFLAAPWCNGIEEFCRRIEEGTR
jgi:hypothetical protein